jgi:RimJ/RimL family protein N-acetyltransferase
MASDRINEAFLEGERIYLRPLREEDAAGEYPHWLNRAEVCRGNSHHRHPFTAQQALEYIRCSRTSKIDLVLAIVMKNNALHIGNIALQSINTVDRTAELSILLGSQEHWGRGYGREAARLICRHGFLSLNLHRIACGTFANNPAMQKIAEGLGMRREGLRRQAAFKSGAYLDVVEYGVLKDEFMASANQDAERY